MRIEPPKRIGLLGHIGTRNLGDEAILASVIQNIRLRRPGAEIVGFTANPEDTFQRHGLRSFPIRQPDKSSGRSSPSEAQPASTGRLKNRLKKIPVVYPLLKKIQRTQQSLLSLLAELKFLAQSYRRLKGVDLLIIMGSQQLNDYFGGPWGFPYTLFKWCGLAKLVGARIAILSVGAGPINTALGRFFVKRVLSLVDYRSYRDQISSDFVEKMGVRGENPVVPDLVYSLRIEPTYSRNGRGPRPVVAVNPVPFFDGRYWPEHCSETYRCYLEKMAVFVQWLIENHYKIVFFPTQLRADPRVIEDLRAMLDERGALDSQQILSPQPIQSLGDLLSTLAGADIVVATRYHGVVLSYLLNKPVLGIAYHKKTEDLMRKIGQSKYALDIQRMDPEVMRERFITLEKEAVAVRQEIDRRLTGLREAVDEQYDRVLHLLES